MSRLRLVPDLPSDCPTDPSYLHRDRYRVHLSFSRRDRGAVRRYLEQLHDAVTTPEGVDPRHLLHRSWRARTWAEATVTVVLVGRHAAENRRIAEEITASYEGARPRAVLALLLPGVLIDDPRPRHTRMAPSIVSYDPAVLPSPLRRLVQDGYAMVRPPPEVSEDVRMWIKTAVVRQVCEIAVRARSQGALARP